MTLQLVHIVVLSAVVLALAYWWYGGLLARLLRLRDDVPTPAVTLRDDVDYVPLARAPLLSQHFSAIAAAGPIAGPILAGAMFGWLPALIWILVGSILIGGVHDATALLASVRHRASSIAEVVRAHMSRRAHTLFLAFIWLALVYVVVAFTDITASSFVGRQDLGGGLLVPGAATASSSLLYLVLPMVMGLLLRFGKLSLGLATVIFLPLVGVSIWVGPYVPLDVAAVFGLSEGGAQRLWNVLLLAYCFAASVMPMWLLLQPRGHLGGYFLFAALLGGALGLVLGGQPVQYPALIGWLDSRGNPLFPVLFITIACGACSGFHAMVASGTTSKQLRCESDVRPVGYGAMLLEAMVAVVSLACVMMLARDSALLSGPKGPQPNYLYANGIAGFLEVLGVARSFGVAFGLMAFTTFVYDTLDVCTRLGRYVLQELTGWQSRAGRFFATAATTGVPLVFLLNQATDASGRPVAAWRVFWNLFGASNQLLAALTLLGVTVWLWRTRGAWWVWLVTGLPAALMYVVSVWELVRMARPAFATMVSQGSVAASGPVPWIAAILIALAVLMLVEAVRVFAAPPSSRAGLAAASGIR